MNRLKDKVCVFVGGGSAVASVAERAFLAEGAKIVQVDVAEKYFERTADLREKYGEGRIVTCIAACTVQEDMDRAMAFAVEKFGRIDVLLNVAGFHGRGHVEDIERSQWDLAISVTCSGAYRATKAAAPYMKAQGHGHVVNFTSLGGRGNRGVAISYAGSKAACVGLSRALAVELAPFGINVVSFAPGSLDTTEFERIPETGSIPMEMPKGMKPGMGMGAGRPGFFNVMPVLKDRPVADLDEIAYALVYLSSCESDFLTGDCVDMNGGILMQP